MIKAIFFDIDDTLYNSSDLAHHARMNAILAMIDSGLSEKDPKKAYAKLRAIVEKYGSNYPHHLDRLLDELGTPYNPAIIAAGVAAYHDTKLSFIRPFPETIPTLLKLRDLGYSLGVISEGLPVKQWEKLIRLGLTHFFKKVIISDSVGADKSSKLLYEIALKNMGCEPHEAIMVGDKPDRDIEMARSVGLHTVLVSKGRKKSNADYTIRRLAELLAVIARIEKKRDEKA